MPVEIRVPQLGESVVEATITRWLKKEGESVAAGEPVVELETDKVNVEVPADQAGVLQSISQHEGQTVAVGDVLAMLADVGAAAPTPLTSPELGTTASNGKTNGSEMPAASPVAKRLAEDKAVDLNLVAGTGPGGRITKDDVANHLERRDEAPATANTLAKQNAEHATDRAVEYDTLPTQPPAPPPAPLKPAATQSLPTPNSGGAGAGRPEERVPMTRRRQTIAKRLVEAQHTTAMLTTFNEVDMTAIMDVRARRKDAFKEKNGVGLGFMSFFTKASIGALKAFPNLNAEIQGTEILVKKYYDIGVAVSTEEGLVVPVVRDADRLSFAGIEKTIGDLAKRARDGKLTLPELTGGTFTITNGGVFGSLMSTPILNAPQVGILGMHKIQERPMVIGGQVVARPMMYLALSYDHRIVDGSEAVRFLVRIKELLEDPESLLLEG
jgi:2-oxoglutarate dehydrogenase E2 component (dihydrolipoamide succinyltransferase)